MYILTRACKIHTRILSYQTATHPSRTTYALYSQIRHTHTHTRVSSTVSPTTLISPTISHSYSHTHPLTRTHTYIHTYTLKIKNRSQVKYHWAIALPFSNRTRIKNSLYSNSNRVSTTANHTNLMLPWHQWNGVSYYQARWTAAEGSAE